MDSGKGYYLGSVGGCCRQTVLHNILNGSTFEKQGEILRWEEFMKAINLNHKYIRN